MGNEKLVVEKYVDVVDEGMLAAGEYLSFLNAVEKVHLIFDKAQTGLVVFKRDFLWGDELSDIMDVLKDYQVQLFYDPQDGKLKLLFGDF